MSKAGTAGTAGAAREACTVGMASIAGTAGCTLPLAAVAVVAGRAAASVGCQLPPPPTPPPLDLAGGGSHPSRLSCFCSLWHLYIYKWSHVSALTPSDQIYLRGCMDKSIRVYGCFRGTTPR